MKDEIKNLQMGSGSTVCSEASTGVGTLLGHHHSPLGGLKPLVQGKWNSKAGSEEYYDPTREDNIKGRNETILALWEKTPQKSNCCVGHSPEVCGKLVLEVSARVLWGGCVLHWLLLASSKVCGESLFGRVFVSGKYGPHGELFFFLIQKEPAIVPHSVTFSPFINSLIRTSPVLR